MNNKFDPDEIATWRRDPITQHLLAEIRRQNVAHRYRVATDMITLGRAQGYDEALNFILKIIEPTERIG